MRYINQHYLYQCISGHSGEPAFNQDVQGIQYLYSLCNTKYMQTHTTIFTVIFKIYLGYQKKPLEIMVLMLEKYFYWPNAVPDAQPTFKHSQHSPSNWQLYFEFSALSLDSNEGKWNFNLQKLKLIILSKHAGLSIYTCEWLQMSQNSQPSLVADVYK